MFYTAAALTAMVATSNGFAIKSNTKVTSSLRMSTEPWFPNSVTSNTVGLDSLE